jgi:nucleotide-binding universal stress UspA family protein
MANTIVCGIDGSKESVAAAEVGVWLAAALEAIPIFVNAVDEATASPQSQSAARETRAKRALDAAHQTLAEVAFDGAQAAERRVVRGTPVGALLRVADETGALAVCVGSRGHGPLHAALLGSTSRAAVRGSACPVLVVPRTAAASAFGGASIVCGLDGSPESENALRAAAKLRRALDLKLVLVHVKTHDALIAVSPGTGPPALDYGEQIERSRRAAATVISRGADRTGVPIEAEERVEAGEASSVIDATAEDEDAALIAVGTHARGALRSAALGSVSSRLAASASRPVLLVRAEAPLRLDGRG